MNDRRGLKWVGVTIYSNRRCVGKTTVAMNIVKSLRKLGYKVIYEGTNENQTELIEEQIRRFPKKSRHNSIVFVEDKTPNETNLRSSLRTT